jgi:hypothetical protein
MNPAGYMLKTAVTRPKWIEAESVLDIYSVSGCISRNFADYIHFWKHNGYWFFNSQQELLALASSEKLDISQMTMLYYEVYEAEYDDKTKQWLAFSPEVSFHTAILEPQVKQLAGFDVTSFSQHTSPECSPLSCNSLATTISVNQHCLFNTFEEAKCALEAGKFENSEPGPFRIFAVYRV